jgi:hypothetical protein
MASVNSQAHPLGKELLIEGLIMLLAVTSFYFLTICPTIGFGDTALIIDSMMRAHLNSHVNNHPLSVGLGYLFTRVPFATIAYRANLMSVVFGAFTVVLLFVCFRVQGVSRLVAIAGAAAAAISHSLWWHSTIVENYAVSATLIAGCYLLLTLFELSSNRRFLYGACVVAGLSIFNHVQNGFLCLGVAVVGFVALYRAVDRIKALFLCAICACIGLLPWVYLVLRDSSSLGLSGALESAFLGKFKDTFFSESIGTAVYEVAYLLWWQSPLGVMSVGALLGVLWYVRRFGASAVFLGMTTHIVMTVGVFAGYATWDRFAFLLAGFIGLHYFAGLGLGALAGFLGKPRGTALVLIWMCLALVVGPTLYGSVVSSARDPLSVWRSRYAGGYSAHLYNQAEYVVNPNKRGYREVETFAELLFDKLPPNSFFLDDDSRSYYPLAEYFQRYYNKRTDISFLLVNSWGFSGWGLSSDSLSTLVERAYYLDKPFFVASTGVPYHTFFNSIRTRIPVQFERFPLSEDRWVYRLVTAHTGGRQTALKTLMEKGVFKPMVVRGARGEVDLTVANVSFSASSGIQMQKMDTFGSTWLMDDQLFVPATNSGSELEFVVKSDGDRKDKIALFLTKAPDFGDVRISVDDKIVGEFSLYSTYVERTRIDLGELGLSPTGNLFSLKVIGKSSASDGYKMGIDSVLFE